MATVRITWTDINADEEGTHIYRDTSPIDLEALPAPLASVGQGVTSYDDDTADVDTTYYYALASYKGSYVAPFDAGSIYVGGTDWGGTSIGDEVEGGIYAGDITYADGREFRLISGKASSESSATQWRTVNDHIGADDLDDGEANTAVMLSAGDSPAADHADQYTSGAYDDWDVPSENELLLIAQNLGETNHPEFTDNQSDFRWASTEADYRGFPEQAVQIRFTDSYNGRSGKTGTNRVRPVRRVPV